ncbi:16S rRNA (guanine(966)-N(2))-methyltransferase RsmD [Sediminibacillus albus]|uniref:16S rRNA (Guanine966-N2)-methyltransferase n=1 Tax=Sediminibacillus albus TaxID=407036 RepID=A0A1G8W8I6_9BACI|nr:16S rRNA (guanine(966)-N(2))-methyltransferase RsmD [Sediminibacillus albus]SDJ74609.1 16S rRNA (guanine966-N2)-methyltransferase [Sediminibacillus albus]
MRVISGKYKGRQIKPVPNRLTRPTTDKVKEALFQIIGPFFQGGNCLDLFAGSGGLGIEALSRGMDKAVFVDKHPKAIRTIHENIQMLHLGNATEVYRTDAFRAIKAAAKRELTFELIFLDPPYGKVSYEDLLESLETHRLLNKNGIIVCEHEGRTSLPDQFAGFEKKQTEIYGNTTALTLYQRKEQSM